MNLDARVVCASHHKRMEWSMPKPRQLLLFVLDDRRFSVDLSVVVRIARMVEITPLPQAPDGVLGLINFQGQIIPVVSVRKRCGLPERSPHLHDRLIILRMPARTVALVVDEVIGVVHRGEQDVVSAQELFPDNDTVEGVVKYDDEIVLIQNSERFLHPEDERKLGEAMADIGGVKP
jgi:purine-binding chemotaxis protein CheW